MVHTRSTDLASQLIRHGVRPSTQRLRIFEYLVASKEHPTADNVFQALLPEIPSLSKTTVYNTLSLLVKEHLARQLSIEDGEARYDGDVSMHGHFRCTHCGAVTDFPVEMGEMSMRGLEGCIVQTKDVFFQGVCRKCIENSK